MPHTLSAEFARAAESAHTWVLHVRGALLTEDEHLAYRALRAWMHTLRDRLPVQAAVHLAAQLPELLRGAFYDGWDPGHAPVKYDRETFAARFAAEAGIPVNAVEKTAQSVTAAMRDQMSHGAVEHALNALPRGVRALIEPVVATSGHAPAGHGRHRA